MSGPPPDLARARALRGPGPAARRGERGAVSWVSAALFVLAAAGGYLGFVWLPVYSENYAVKQVVRSYMNQAIKNPDDRFLLRSMVHKLRSLAEIDGFDAAGQPARVPAIVVDESGILWERDPQSQPPVLRVAFEYHREVPLPGLERVATKVFTVDLTNDLTLPDWGPAR